MREWLVESRKKKKLSQKNIADHLGVSQQIVGKWENGIRTPKPDTAKKIAKILGFEWTKFYENQKSD